MTRTELIIQLLKVAIALAFGAYFVWWSLQVLERLTPEYDAASAMVGPIFMFKRVARPGVMDMKTGHRSSWLMLGSSVEGSMARAPTYRLS
jgi:hypothetical protein